MSMRACMSITVIPCREGYRWRIISYGEQLDTGTECTKHLALAVAKRVKDELKADEVEQAKAGESSSVGLTPMSSAVERRYVSRL